MAEKETASNAEKSQLAATRRELLQIGNALALPLLFGAAGASARAEGPLTPGPGIYQSIGVEPVINCRGTFTIIGGSSELPEVRAAMDAATKYFAQLDEVADGVGRRLAELTGAEWGMVSSGCAAGLKHVTAACVTGGNPEKLIRIPNLAGFEKTEVVVPSTSRTVYDHAIRNIGVQMINVDTPEEMANAIGPRTAMIYLMADREGPSRPLDLENVAKIAKPRNIPILVDAAAEILTIPCVHLQKGATVVAYSGGKAIRGPQCAGLLLGSKDILMAAWQASAPHHGPGRDNKVGREETLGMLAAVEAWVKRDHEAEWKTWLTWLDTISKRVKTVDGVSVSLREPTGLGNRSPSLTISWDPARLHMTGEDAAEELATTKPRIALGSRTNSDSETSITVTAWMMQPGDDKVAAERIHSVLSKKRSPRPKMKPPAVDLSGHWDVELAFFHGNTTHSLYLEQDGNWISGTHRTDFETRELFGAIDGNQVTLRSDGPGRHTGDSVPFIFSAAAAENGFGGPVHMGEYLNAKFEAKRHGYPTRHEKIRVPNGPPLAT
ncbi:MAG: aminotransferase class V-fold PLP-dependent enzyme [Acidobacteria bacterium]|nr:aminotransferase class V-fold PLP-dependent enzyme [Acidobacteriota bacterium]